jgi:hypothetical protein
LTFAKGSGTTKHREDLNATAIEIEQDALKAVINLVEVSKLVDLTELLEHRVVEECVALFNCNCTHRKTQKRKLIQKFSLQYVEIQEPYIAVVDIGMIWRMATPTAEDRQTQDGTPYKWSDYVHKLTSSILSRYRDAKRIICVNDPYDTAYSTKYDDRDLRVQGKAHIPNTYMKLDDPFPSAGAFKTLLCSSSNKRRLQALVCNYLTDYAQTVEPVETLSPRQLSSVLNAPPFSEKSSFPTRSWLGVDRWSLSPCSSHTTCSPCIHTCTGTS